MDQENRKSVRHGKNKKLVLGVIGILLVGLVSVFSYLVYKKEVYIATLLREKLKVEFKEVNISILNRKLDLTDVKYIVPEKISSKGKILGTEYSTPLLDINFEEIDLKNRVVSIDKAELKELGIKTVEVTNLQPKADTGSGMISETIGTEKSEDYKVDSIPEAKVEETTTPIATTTSTAAATPAEKSDETKFSVKSESKSKNIFKSFLEKIESTLTKKEDKTESAIAFIDEELLDTLINEKIGRRIEWKLNKNIVPKIKSKFIELNTPSKDGEWKVRIDRFIGDTLYKEIKFYGEVNDFSYPLNRLEKNISYNIYDEKKENILKGEISVPTPYISLDVDFKNFNLKLVPESQRYLTSGKVTFVEKAEYKEEILKLGGQISITEMKLNTNQIAAEILKSKKISNSDPRAKVLRYVLERLNSCKIDYRYDSKSGRFIISTDLQKSMKEIMRKDFFIIATEIAK